MFTFHHWTLLYLIIMYTSICVHVWYMQDRVSETWGVYWSHVTFSFAWFIQNHNRLKCDTNSSPLIIIPFALYVHLSVFGFLETYRYIFTLFTFSLSIFPYPTLIHCCIFFYPRSCCHNFFIYIFIFFFW